MAEISDEQLKALIAAEVARQLKDIRNLPLDELAKAINERLAKHMCLQGGVSRQPNLIEEGH